MNHSRPIIFSVVFLVSLILACAMSSSGAKPDGVNSRAAPSVAATAVSPALTGPVSGLANSASSTWQPAGFGGRRQLGVFFDPSQPGVVYAASDVAGVFRSTDNGDHWQMQSLGLGNYKVSSFAKVDIL
jgi:hypothetical protein